MKLKIRAVAGVALAGSAVVLFGLFTVYGFMEYPQSKTMDSVRTGPLQPPDLKQLQGDQNRAWPLEGSWSELKGHLQLMRKDLDASNFTSSEGRSPETNSKLLGQILQDEVFQKDRNVETFLRIAHVLEEHRNKELGILPQKSQNLPSEEVQPPHRREDEERQKKEEEEERTAKLADAKIDVLISDQIVAELQSVVDKMVPSHKAKPKRHGISLNLYTSEKSSKLANWQKFHRNINQFGMYSDNDPVVDDLLHDLTYLPLVDMYQKSGGTQIKLVYYFSNEGRAMFKPMRFPREQETLPDHFYFTDFERHTAEIAAFHLDRILGFHRVPPAAGRLVNVTHDIKRLADKKLLKTVFVSPAGNVCFHGQCDYYCDTSHAVCGHPDTLEGSLGSFLPSSNYVDRKTWRHPWRRSYHKRDKADWETDMHYCKGVRNKTPYNAGRRLLDLMDMAVFDFFQGNLDRHHYETLRPFGNFTFPLHLDNGRGFGKTRIDYIDVLAPIYHCCLIRYSTIKSVLDFHTGTPLSDRMRDSLSKDSLTQYAPILTEGHLTALDRRVRIILKTVHKCIQDNGGRYTKVVVDDGF